MRRSDFGLPEDAFVYCCMNSLHKLDPATFDVWMRVLARVPDSLLWLFEGTTETGKQNLLREARQRGVEPERIRFAGKLPLSEYLARYRLADLFLDTFAYNAGATAIGALQAGLPVLTRPGGTYFSRMGASICSAAGLPDLVCASAEEYEERAVEFGSNPIALDALRRRLVATRESAPLFDLARTARNLERAYRMMWNDHRAGVAPQPHRVEPSE
jgi:protein O-GlcNAc transferase